MRNILVVEGSARRSRSLTRNLSAEFRERWLERFTDDHFVCRDVGSRPPPFICEDWIAAAFCPEDERSGRQQALLALSDELIGEVGRADVIVIATPMYNYGMPAALKAWLDQVVRIGQTFSFDLDRGDWPLRPMLTGKVLVTLTSSGEFGFGAGGPRAHMNHLVPHLRAVSSYLGAVRLHHIGIEYQEFGDARHIESVAAARAAVPFVIDQIVNDLHVLHAACASSALERRSIQSTADD
jgi:FMN-dependent NADH-azoreductase